MLLRTQTERAPLGHALDDLRGRMLDIERSRADLISELDAPAAASARNLMHYVALRERDLRPLQASLVERGLSSLGRCEPWVLGSIEATRRAAAALDGEPPRSYDDAGAAPPLSMNQGHELLERRTEALFGTPLPHRAVRIMVTLPDLAADDPIFIETCIEHGMDAARINTASGDPETWSAMVDHVRAAEHRLGRTCRVFADLAGPKIRVTGLTRGKRPTDRVRLRVGDTIRLAFNSDARGKKRDITVKAEPASILARVEPDQAVWFDDGKVGAVIERVAEGVAIARVTFTKPGGQRLRWGKGINLPDTTFEARALTDTDRACVRALWGRADALSLSFVRAPSDVADLIDELRSLEDELGGPAPAIVLKIETRGGFERLPDLLLELLRWPVGGVMLARGDLAVECGFERTAEIQEELLCFCEAAHTPVIWATEVLTTLAKQGRPTRAEITDAATAQRAECVMLNKGPEIPRAVSTLCDILRRMQAHQRKKTAMFRPLSIAVRAAR